MNPVSVLDATQLYTLKVVEVVTFMVFVSYHTHTHKLDLAGLFWCV